MPRLPKWKPFFVEWGKGENNEKNNYQFGYFRFTLNLFCY